MHISKAALLLLMMCACTAPGPAAPNRSAEPSVAQTARSTRSVPSSHSPDAAGELPGFAGSWRTSYGALRLKVEGLTAKGRYRYGSGGTIEGLIEGRTLRARYEEPGGVTGRARFVLSEDGASFRGIWRAGAVSDAELDAGPSAVWEGTRIVPVANRTWLIVLEAYWQGDLLEPDYSYGEMLGAFFERLPDVEFRQRFFAGPEDFERIVSECAQLEEPVVLYISSHGSPEGIHSPQGMIAGDVLGRAVAQIPNLRLLHLGACEALLGELPARIRAAAGEDTSFPISGFTRKVDWGGSALVDFTYLDLVLERGLEPEQAVAQTRRLVLFAGAGVPEDAAIPATDLKVSQP